jgi:hypothetical protein
LIWTSSGRLAAGPPLPADYPEAAARSGNTIGLTTAVAGAGAALLVAAVIVLSDGELVRTTVTATVAAILAVGGAALIGSPRWRGLGGVLAIAGFLGALIAIGARLILLLPTASASIEPDLWAAIALGITAAIGVMALRATTGTPAAATVAPIVGVAFSAALLFFTAVELLLLGADVGDELRTVFTMSALSVAGVGGVLLRFRLGLTPPLTAAIAAAVFGVTALALYSVAPVELVTVPPAFGLIALGARALRQRPQARTWPTLGPGLALLTVPSLLHDFFGGTDLWRVVALGVVAIVLVVVGALWRLQAPLVLGSAVLLAHAVAQLWPWIVGVRLRAVVAVARHRRRAAHLPRRALREQHAGPAHVVHRRRVPALSPHRGHASRAPRPHRNAETVGSPSIQNRQGNASVPAVPATPTRGPVAKRSKGSVRSDSRAIAPACSMPVTASMPSCTGCRSPTASPSRPGPRARSRSACTTPRRSRRRRVAASRPSTISPARSRIPPAMPSGPLTTFTHEWMPWLRYTYR